jgi:hypothetical protein
MERTNYHFRMRHERDPSGKFDITFWIYVLWFVEFQLTIKLYNVVFVRQAETETGSYFFVWLFCTICC